MVGTVPTTGQPGSAALAGGLGIYTGDISPPIQLGGKEETPRSVWNVASLRTKDETGSEA
jgi:hypothetical protein